MCWLVSLDLLTELHISAVHVCTCKREGIMKVCMHMECVLYSWLGVSCRTAIHWGMNNFYGFQTLTEFPRLHLCVLACRCFNELNVGVE